MPSIFWRAPISTSIRTTNRPPPGGSTARSPLQASGFFVASRTSAAVTPDQSAHPKNPRDAAEIISANTSAEGAAAPGSQQAQQDLKNARGSDSADTLAVPVPIPQLARLELVAERARDYAAAARAPATRRAYAQSWRHFSSWCASAGLQALPASGETLVLYLTDFASTLKTATLQRHLSAIAQVHKLSGHESPIADPRVRLVWAGIRRTLGTSQEGKAPALVEDLQAMIARMAPRRGKAWQLLELRDRALLLVGFAGGFRRSELVGLDVEDLVVSRPGMVVYLRRSKTDQEGAGRRIGIPRGHQPETCPCQRAVGVPGPGGHRVGCDLPRSEPPWPAPGAIERQRCRCCCEAAGGGNRPGSSAVRRPQPARGAGHFRGGRGCLRASDHGSDWAPVAHHGPSIYSERRAFSADQCRGDGRSLSDPMRSPDPMRAPARARNVAAARRTGTA